MNTTAPIKAISITYTFKGRRIDCKAYIKGSPSDTTSLLYLGTMQGPALAKRIARKCSPGVVVIQCFPHWKAAKDGSDMVEFAEAFTFEVFKQIKKQFGITRQLTVLAESQAAPGAIRLTRLNTDSVRRLILLQPLGLNWHTYNNAVDPTVDVFKKRIRQNLSRQKTHLTRDRGLRYNHALLGIMGAREILRGRADKQYRAGLLHDASTDLKHVTEKTVIVAGELDQLFPPKEIKAMLEENDMQPADFIVIPKAAHSPLLSTAGTQLLNAAIEAGLVQ